MITFNKTVLFVFIVILIWYFIPVYRKPMVISKMVSKEDCEHIIKEAENKLIPSTVAKDRVLQEETRKSETAWLNNNDPVVKRVIDKCLKMTDRPFPNCEQLQVLKYKPGGFYKPHQDAFKKDKNRRVHTFVIALNDDYEGGETAFPHLNKKFKMEKGDVLFFDTLNNYNCVTRKALHGGNPVKSGEKWICNLWVHKYPFKNTK